MVFEINNLNPNFKLNLFLLLQVLFERVIHFFPFSPQQERQVLCVTPKSAPKGGKGGHSGGASKKKHVSET